MNILRIKSIELTHIFSVCCGFRHCYSCYTTVEVEVRSLDFVLQQE